MRIEYHMYASGEDSVIAVFDHKGEQVDCVYTMEQAVAICLESYPLLPEVTLYRWADYAEHNEQS